MLLSRTDSILLVVDAQERLVPAIERAEEAIARIIVLAAAARQLGVPILASEQYPKGLGRTVRPIADAMGGVTRPIEKTDFSCTRVDAIAAAVAATGRRQIVMCGFETHICVLQSTLGFLEQRFELFVAADATGSRTGRRHQLGLERMRAAGASVIDSEMAVFEWLGRAGTDEFRAIQKLIK